MTAFLDLFKGDQKAARGAVETFCERFKVAPDHKKTLFTNCEDEDWRHALADALSDGDHMGLSELEELFTNRSPGLSSPVGLAKLLCLSVKRPAFDALSIFKYYFASESGSSMTSQGQATKELQEALRLR